MVTNNCVKSCDFEPFSASYIAVFELILVGLNVEVDDQKMKTFCDSYSLTSIMEQQTCYKNPSHPKCTDLILTNVLLSFQITCVIETGLSDFHFMILTVMRKKF